VGLLGMIVVAGCGRDGVVFKSAIALTVDLSAHHMFIVGFLGWADVYTQEIICTSNSTDCFSSLAQPLRWRPTECPIMEGKMRTATAAH